jgi:hypothetical protein
MAKCAKVINDIDHDYLRRLYIDSGYSVRKLQNVFRKSGENIRATLEFLNITSDMRNKEYDYVGASGRPRRLTDYQVGFNRVKKQYLHGAKKRKLQFNLTDSEIDALIMSNCSYCGFEPNQCYTLKDRNNYQFYYNGIDRIDSSVGYEPNNVVPCCKTCNFAKGTMSSGEFYLWIERVYKFVKGGES